MKWLTQIGDKLQSLSCGVIRAVGTCIFAFLTLFSLIYTQYLPPQAEERPVNCSDAPVFNLLAVGILILCIFSLIYLGKKQPQKVIIRVELISLLTAMLWVGGWGTWWICGLNRVPEGDQAFIYTGASCFLKGDYSFLETYGYCGIYPHQLGLIALMELLFLAVGVYNYFAFEVISVILAVGIVLLGYYLLKESDMPHVARMLYCLLVMGCVPLVCYTSWVYGDIPSIFFAMLTALLVVRYHNYTRKRYLVGVVLSCVMAMLVRKNSTILLIALALLAVVYAIRYCRWQITVTVAVAILCSVLCYQGIYKMYEFRSGYERSEGLPINSWIAMGLQENRGVCGWYNNMPKEVLNSLDYDYVATENAMTEYIGERLHTFAENPKYAMRFFGKKVLSQWNEPLYQSIYFSAKGIQTNPPESGSLMEKIYDTDEEYSLVYGFADRMQFVIYFGMLLYCLLAVQKQAQPLGYLLVVVIIGGFFFSVIWEAKARYIFPYYVMMYPLAAVGYYKMTERISAFVFPD